MGAILSAIRHVLLGEDDEGKTRALVTGSVAVGALITGAIVRRVQKRGLPAQDLPPVIDAPVHELEIMEGRYRFYARDGIGVPIVLLHSINAAAGSFEMKPIFDYLSASTPRPIFAVDWIGFGLSDRPPVDYRPSVFRRQLRRFLSEHIHQPADVVAFSLASDFAAVTAVSHPFLFRRLVFISPTGLGARSDVGSTRRAIVKTTTATGLFELSFQRMTSPQALQNFYRQNVFMRRSAVSQELVDAAHASTQARGAHHAPASFIAGDLHEPVRAFDAHTSLAVPSLYILPSAYRSPLQSFERLPELQVRNPRHVHVARLQSGLMPQWETPELLAKRVAAFLSEEPLLPDV